MSKRNLRLALFALLAFAALILGLRAAAHAEDDPLVAFAQKWDGDRNGIYTCSEWKLFMRRLFAKADRNRDGFIEAPEFRTISSADPVFAETTLAYFDVNGDRKLVPAELIDRENPFFLRYDFNHDCQVTMQEIIGDGTGQR